ncbi:CRISPR-associated endonuclease Cas2 [Deinococcus marmoris]|uniref:CRISPR-associated endonuclease Cas2 n=1 Tax=Deinococcus marmoris TaxID=249408 RepID=UPI000689CEFE|nr:CRISPR-associated endonuclease Cas2 [Deinococcus marmoris]
MIPGLHVVCYDTSSDARRRRFVGLLSRRGRRVQYSVFELLLDAARLRRLTRQLAELMEDDDSILIYATSSTRLCLGRDVPALDEQPRTQVI